jgi:hypothetical protein
MADNNKRFSSKSYWVCISGKWEVAKSEAGFNSMRCSTYASDAEVRICHQAGNQTRMESCAFLGMEINRVPLLRSVK